MEKIIAYKSKKIVALLLSALVLLIANSENASADEAIVFYEMPDCRYSFFENDFESYDGWSRIDNNETWHCSSAAYVINSTVDAKEHGKVARLVASKSQNINLNTQYSIVNDLYSPGTLKRFKFETDICFTGYAPGVITMLDSGFEKPDKTFNELVFFDDNGNLSISGNNFKNETVKEKYKKIDLNTWYTFRFDINAENNTFSLFINNDAVSENTPLPKSSTDLLCMRLCLTNASEQNDGNICYVDNWKYSVPEEKLSEINLTVVNDSITADFLGYGDKYKNSELILALFNNDGVLTLCKSGTKTINSDISRYKAEEILTIGQTAKAILLSDDYSLKPIVSSYVRRRYTQEDFAILRDKWKKSLTVFDDVNLDSPYIKAKLTTIEKSGENAFYNLIDSPEFPQDPWGDVITETSHMTNAYSRIYNLARAYATKGSKYYHNSQFLDKTIYCIEYMYNNFYGQKEIDGCGWKSTSDYSWWDWFVQTPRFLTDSLLMLGESVDHKSVTKYLSLFDHLRDTMKGVPELSRVYGVYAAAVLEGDNENLEKIENLIRSEYEYTNNSIGMHKDGSYTAHNNIAYTSMYGTARIDRLLGVYNIAANTPFAQPQICEEIFRQWTEKAFEPIIVNGGFMSMFNGRGIDYEKNELIYSRTFFERVLECIRNNCANSSYFKKIVKENIKGDVREYYLKSLSINGIDTLEKILAEPVTSERPAFSKVYGGMDRVIHRRKDWTCGIAMSSSRIANYESINWCNTDGWYTGDGMMYIYINDDTTQYDLSYWKNTDHYRMPGTTEDIQPRTKTSIVLGREFFPNRDFVGGVSDGEYSVATMDFEAYHCEDDNYISDNPNGTNRPQHFCTLKAYKSWFMFDDEIVCLGSGINANDNSEVRTYVENRKTENPSDVIQRGNFVYVPSLGGYVFPSGVSPVLNTTDKGFFEIWLSHGVNPKNENYDYTVLPCKTETETENYAVNPDTEILRNDNDVQAVRENSISQTGYVFRKATSFDGITVSDPIVMMTKKNGKDLTLSVADPTHKKTDITIILNGKYSCPSSEKIRVQSGENTVIKIDLSGSLGQTYNISLEG